MKTGKPPWSDAEEVRLSRTSYHRPRKFDHVEENKRKLLRTTGTTPSSGNRCEVTVYIEAVEQDVRKFGYWWKFVDRTESS